MKNILIMLVASSLLLGGCTSGGDSEPVSVAISFLAEATDGGLSVNCNDQLNDLGTAFTSVDIKDFRFYVHNVKLFDVVGKAYTVSLTNNPWQNSGVALLDFTNLDSACSGDVKDTRTRVTGSVSAFEGAVFTSVEFTIGVPESVNHNDALTASAPLNITDLNWNRTDGYRFMRLDVAPVGGVNAGAETNWNFHLGSKGCTGNPALGEEVACTQANRPVIRLYNFDVGRDDIVFDYQRLVETSDLTLDDSTSSTPACESDQTDVECANLFTALGLDITTGQLDPDNLQAVFSVR